MTKLPPKKELGTGAGGADDQPSLVTQAKRRERAELEARIALLPTVNASRIVATYSGTSTDALPVLIEELRMQVGAIGNGSLDRPEAMLVAQMHSLDAMFAHLAECGRKSQNLPQLETYTRLALKCQSQCRATVEALARIKNPPSVAFVTQANIAHGPQQVNNGGKPEQPAKSRNPQSKLLETTDGQRLDTGTTGTASRTDPHLEAVGAINRAEDEGR